MRLFGFNFLTPLWLFCILLATLVIACVFGNCHTFEGLINYNTAITPFTVPNTTDLSSGGYNNGVYKLYDNNYWDDKTGNLVRLYEKSDGSLSRPYIYTVRERSGTSVVREWSKNYDDSSIKEIVSKASSDGMVISNKEITDTTYKANIGITSGNPNTNNIVFYIPFEKDTYIHIIDPTDTTNIHKFTSFIRQNTDNVGKWFWSAPDATSNNKTTVITAPPTTITLANPTLSSDDDKKRYKQITTGVYYDISSGFVNLYKSGDTSTTIYAKYTRDGLVAGSDAPVTKTDTMTTGYHIPMPDKIVSTDITSSNAFKPYIIWINTVKFILVVPFRKTTFIAVIRKNESDTTQWDILDTFKYNETGQVFASIAPQTGSGSGSSGNDTSGNDTTKNDASGNDTSGNDTSANNTTDISGNDDFWKWYWYWKTEGGSDMSSDYILKTQVVPPVCPTCPRCPHGGGACTNCGGQGGSGTVGQAGSTLVGGVTGSVNNAVNTTGNLIGSVGTGITNTATNAVVGGTILGAGAINTASGLGGKVLDSGTGLAKDTLGLAKDTVSGTVGLAKDTVSGTVGLAKDTVSGTVGLAKDVVSGTVGLAKDAVSGTTGLLTGKQGYSQDQQTNTNSYSYNGTLPSRGSTNFMPVTADFSRFGR
jgi:hypothetical protein